MTIQRVACPGSFAVVLALALVLASAAHGDTVSGVVRDEASGTPIAGALVSLQASGIRTMTAVDGSYALDVPAGSDLVIVAAQKGYYNESTLANPPQIDVDIDLEAVPPHDNPEYIPIPPQGCTQCHPDQVEQWTGSPMANAGINTWVHDIYNGLGTPGGKGGFVYTRDSVFATHNPNSECASCHQPESWLAATFSRMEGPQDPGYPSLSTTHGISCDVCHKIADVNVENINYPGLFPGTTVFTRPEGPDFPQVQYGRLGDADFVQPGAMRPTYQPQLCAAVCGVCHQDKNDPDETHAFDGIISEPTYLEWLDSPYSNVNSPVYADCLDCHMLPSGATEACAVLFPPLTRDPETLRDHNILGTTPVFLENAAELDAVVDVSNGSIWVTVDVTNSQVGHHLPTGVTVRNMILVVEAWLEEDGTPLTHTGTQTIHDLGGVGAAGAEEGYYAGLPGKFYAKVNHNAQGQGPTYFTDATGIQFDNRIHALQTDTTFYTFAAPQEPGSVRVRARLIYRRAFRFLVDAKQWTEDGHGQPLADVQPPHYGHLMEISEQVIATCGAADLDGSASVGFSDLIRILATWGPCEGCPEDIDGNGRVGFGDLTVVLNSWGTCL